MHCLNVPVRKPQTNIMRHNLRDRLSRLQRNLIILRQNQTRESYYELKISRDFLLKEFEFF